jgi:hypothetical protein
MSDIESLASLARSASSWPNDAALSAIELSVDVFLLAIFCRLDAMGDLTWGGFRLLDGTDVEKGTHAYSLPP